MTSSQTTMLGKRNHEVYESDEPTAKRVKTLPSGAAVNLEADESVEDLPVEDLPVEEPTQAFCETQYHSFKSRVVECSNLLHAMEMSDEAQYYWELLERLYPHSQVLHDDTTTEDQTTTAASAVVAASAVAAAAEHDDDPEVPYLKDEDIHPIYGDISKYNTDDVDTDVE